MTEVAIVICNYNKRDFVLDCIDSVLSSEFADFDLIVVDNASTDGSVEAIRERFGERLLLLVNESNTGGSGGFNRGMEYALEHDYKYVHLLDNDVIVDKHAVGALYEFMEEHENVGGCASVILRMDDRNKIQEYGSLLNLDTFDIKTLNTDELCSDALPKYKKCDTATACSSAFRVSALKKAGIMDTEYFIYWDDIALSWKIRLAGYDIYATAKSKIWHHGTWMTRTAFARYYNLRNKLLIFTRYLDDKKFEQFVDAMVLRTFRMLAVNRHERDFCHVYMHALNDALNGVFGKAEDYKIAAKGAKREIPDGMQIITVPHVLDVGAYDRSKAYVDAYHNVLFGDEDIAFVKNIDSAYAFFKDTMGILINSRLKKMREKVRDGKPTIVQERA